MNRLVLSLAICLGLSACAAPPEPPPALPDPPVVAPDPVPDPVPDPIPPPAGVVRLEGHAFADDDGVFNAWGATLMWAMWGAKHDPAMLAETLDYLSTYRVSYIRVLSMVGSLPYWENRRIDPRWPDYESVLNSLLDAASERGMRVQVVLFADADTMMPDQDDRRDWVQQMAIWLEARRSAVQFVEVANESNLNGVDDDDLRDLTVLWDGISPIPVAPSSPDGGDAEVGINRLFDGHAVGADLLTPHFDRDLWEDGYRPQRQPWEVQFYETPISAFTNNEPIGPGSSGETEIDPARLAIGLATTFISGGAGFVLHSSAGVRGLEEFGTVVTPDIMMALRATLDLLPAGIANAERCNHHWDCHPYETHDQIWTDTGGDGVVRAYAVNMGALSYVAVMGLQGSYTVTAKWTMGIEVFDVRTGERTETVELDEGQEWVFYATPARDFIHRITRR